MEENKFCDAKRISLVEGLKPLESRVSSLSLGEPEELNPTEMVIHISLLLYCCLIFL